MVEPVEHDAHGNVSYLPHLGGADPRPNLHWDHRDRLRGLDLASGGSGGLNLRRRRQAGR